MVRAVKFEVTSSGSYFNMSTGIFINQSGLPGNAGAISGETTVCQGQQSVTYTVPSIPNAITYTWTLPDGVTGTSATNSIVVDYGSSAASGNITVKGNKQSGNGAVSTLAITVIQLPVSSSVTGTIPAVNAQKDETLKNREQLFIKVFPNPTSGNVKLVVQGTFPGYNVAFEVYGIWGERTMSGNLYTDGEYGFSLTGRMAGIYCIHVISGAKVEMVKLIKY
ncbi:MAG: T9SS type A sorting domain-containing protein [Bacteroidales bacterium]|nr:T9SS type A sorting domain-containing protein [Bacteroidales bacterium]